MSLEHIALQFYFILREIEVTLKPNSGESEEGRQFIQTDRQTVYFLNPFWRFC